MDVGQRLETHYYSDFQFFLKKNILVHQYIVYVLYAPVEKRQKAQISVINLKQRKTN